MYFLRFADEYLEDAQGFKTLREAREAYEEVAEELYRYGQAIEATVHVAKCIDEVAEYPDCLFSYEDGRVIKEAL